MLDTLLERVNFPLLVSFLSALVALVVVVIVGGPETAKAVQLDSLAFGLGTAVAGNAIGPSKAALPEQSSDVEDPPPARRNSPARKKTATGRKRPTT